jgi:hypothetical protein
MSYKMIRLVPWRQKNEIIEAGEREVFVLEKHKKLMAPRPKETAQRFRILDKETTFGWKSWAIGHLLQLSRRFTVAWWRYDETEQRRSAVIIMMWLHVMSRWRCVATSDTWTTISVAMSLRIAVAQRVHGARVIPNLVDGDSAMYVFLGQCQT